MDSQRVAKAVQRGLVRVNRRFPDADRLVPVFTTTNADTNVLVEVWQDGRADVVSAEVFA